MSSIYDPEEGESNSFSVQQVSISDLRPTPENWTIYNKPTDDDPEFQALIASIDQEGVREPLTISGDGYILSGHRRHAAAVWVSRTTVPAIRIDSITIGDMEPDDRVKILIEHNRGARVKTDAERIREALAEVDHDEAVRYAESRRAKVFTQSKTLNLEEVAGEGASRRTDPTGKRREMLDACIAILNEARAEDMLPLSSRSIHYQLLGREVRTSSTKAGHIYGTGPSDPALLSKLLTDARSAGLIDDTLLTDETRPIFEPRFDGSFANHVRWSVNNLIPHYFKPMHREQPYHVEMIIEKNTLFPLIERKVARPMRIPLTAARGYPSYPVGCAIRDRFDSSGKDELAIIYISDHDPEGVDMPAAFEKYFSEDHVIFPRVIRAAVTLDQIYEHDLPPDADAKPSSTRFKSYVEKTGEEHAWELDSMPPALLVEEVERACLGVMDRDLLNVELEEERQLNIKGAKIQRAILTELEPMLDGLLEQ